MQMRIPHELELSSTWPCENLSQQETRKPIPLWYGGQPPKSHDLERSDSKPACLSHYSTSLFPQMQASHIMILCTNGRLTLIAIIFQFLTYPYPLFSFPLILKMDRLPPEVFTHRHLTSFMSCATTSKRKQINSIFTRCQGKKQSTVAVLFPTQAHYYGTVKGPDSKAG